MAPLRDARPDSRDRLHHQRACNRLVLGRFQPERTPAARSRPLRQRHNPKDTPRQKVRPQGECLPLARARNGGTPRPAINILLQAIIWGREGHVHVHVHVHVR